MGYKMLFKLKKLAEFIINLIIFLLSLRFLFKLLGLSSNLSLVSWVYANTEPLLSPLIKFFPTPKVSQGLVLEFTTLFAIFGYLFLGYLIQLILKNLKNK
jgi:hypothetical protein